MEAQQPGDEETPWLHWRESGTGSSDLLVKHERHNKPPAVGIDVYLSFPFSSLVNDPTEIEVAGGKARTGRTLIPESMGKVCLLLDTEVNRIAMHSRK